MAKSFEYKVKVYDEDDNVTTVTEKSWTKGKRSVIRACVVGGASKAVMPHREPSKTITCTLDGKGIYRAYIGPGKAIQATLNVGGKVKIKGHKSLVTSAYNMLDYRLNTLKGAGIKLQVVENGD